MKSFCNEQFKKRSSRQYKERKTPRGIFVVRCTINSQVWVGSSRNLDGAKNGLWFSLRLGGHRDKQLQEQWTQHGEEAFQYEVLELLDDNLSPLALADTLKEKKSQWIVQLQASPLL